MRVLIVDDERLARVEMNRLLAAHPDLEVVGEAGNADQAKELILSLKPDLLFLDIEMPGSDVFSMLESLETVPLVVFTTAYHQYALQAFDCNVLDYLLKPVEPARLQTTLEKYRRLHAGDPPPGQAVRGPDDRIFLRDGSRCWFVRLGEVAFFQSEGNYSRLHFGEHTPLVLRSLNYLQQRLDGSIFFRAGRCHLINLQHITRVEPGRTDGLTVTLDHRWQVPVSRRQTLRFRSLLSL